MKFVAGKNRRNSEKSLSSLISPTRNPNGVTETRILGPSGGRRASNRLRHGANFHIAYQSMGGSPGVAGEVPVT